MAKSWKVEFKPRVEANTFAEALGKIEAYTECLISNPLPPGIRADMDRLNIIRAIKGTTGIEGNRLSEEQVEGLVERDGPVIVSNIEEQEVVNADEVVKYIKKEQVEEDVHLTEDLVKTLHSLNTQSCDYEDNVPGKYRRDWVWVGSYTCPDPKDVPRLMMKFTSFINSEEILSTHPLIRAAIVHFYLVSIHPFADGNGRTARAAEAYIIYNGGFDQVGFYSLANFYYQNRSEYIRQISAARFEHKGDLNGFVRFAIDGFLSELKVRNREIDLYYKTLAYSRYLDDLVQAGRISKRMAELLKTLVDIDHEIPITHFRERTIPWIAEIYKGLSDRSVRNDLTIMRKLDLIREEDGILVPNTDVIDNPETTNSHSPVA